MKNLTFEPSVGAKRVHDEGHRIDFDSMHTMEKKPSKIKDRQRGLLSSLRTPRRNLQLYQTWNNYLLFSWFTFKAKNIDICVIDLHLNNKVALKACEAQQAQSFTVHSSFIRAGTESGWGCNPSAPDFKFRLRLVTVPDCSISEI